MLADLVAVIASLDIVAPGDRSLTTSACRSLVDSLIAERRRCSRACRPAVVLRWSRMLVFGGIVVFGFVLHVAGVTTWVERRVVGAHPVAHRAEPRRARRASCSGSPTASRLLKEDIIPTAADAPLFSSRPTS